MGLKEFDPAKHFKGRPCKHGHPGNRYLNRPGCCIDCAANSARKFRSENAIEQNIYHADYRANNPSYIAWTRDRKAARIKRIPKWADRAKIREFYLNCPEGMVVDHIVPLRGKLVSGLHVHWNLQYLTVAKNCSKSNKFDPMTYEQPELF